MSPGNGTACGVQSPVVLQSCHVPWGHHERCNIWTTRRKFTRQPLSVKADIYTIMVYYKDGTRPSTLGPDSTSIRARASKRVLRSHAKGPGRFGDFAGAPLQGGQDGLELGSALMARGRPPCFPRRRAATNPAVIRSWVKARSYLVSAPKRLNRKAPCGMVVSICSVRERNATPWRWRVRPIWRDGCNFPN